MTNSQTAPTWPRHQRWHVNGFRVSVLLYKSHRRDRCHSCDGLAAIHWVHAERPDGMSAMGNFCDAHRPPRGTLPPLPYERSTHADRVTDDARTSIVTVVERLTATADWSCDTCGQPGITRTVTTCIECDDPSQVEVSTCRVIGMTGPPQVKTRRYHRAHELAVRVACPEHRPDLQES